MTTAQEVIYERPPEGLARGRVPVPWWIILGLAAVIVLTAVAFLIVRWVVAARAAKGPAIPPKL